MTNDTTMASKEIQELFERYEQHAQKFEYRKIARLYGKKLVGAGPAGVSFHNNHLIARLRYGKAMKEYYNKAGLSSIVINSISEEEISNRYCLVKVTWTATFLATREQRFVFHITYIVHKTRSKPEIVMYIAHEDEAKILQGYGIVP